MRIIEAFGGLDWIRVIVIFVLVTDNSLGNNRVLI